MKFRQNRYSTCGQVTRFVITKFKNDYYKSQIPKLNLYSISKKKIVFIYNTLTF